MAPKLQLIPTFSSRNFQNLSTPKNFLFFQKSYLSTPNLLIHHNNPSKSQLPRLLFHHRCKNHPTLTPITHRNLNYFEFNNFTQQPFWSSNYPQTLIKPRSHKFSTMAENKNNSTAISDGLKGVVAGNSAIATVGVNGVGLNYRGYSIEVLAENCCFEEVAYLLMFGDLPDEEQLSQFMAEIASNRGLSKEMKDMLKMIPATAHPMDVMKVAAGFYGVFHPETDPAKEQIKIATALIGQLSSCLLYWYNFAHMSREIVETTSMSDSVVEHFYKVYKNNHEIEIHPLVNKTLNISLILYAEHDFNASTFASRITASTLSDIYSSVCTAIGTLKGPLHGGANEAAIDMLRKIMGNPEDPTTQVMEMLNKKQLIMGFGHRLYKKEDPRSPIIKKCSYELSKEPFGEPHLYEVSTKVEELLLSAKGMHANLDFYSASAYSQCGIDSSLFTPLFVISRIAGWAAHIVEQRANNRLIRPMSNYIGPQNREFIPIKKRFPSSKH